MSNIKKMMEPIERPCIIVYCQGNQFHNKNVKKYHRACYDPRQNKTVLIMMCPKLPDGMPQNMACIATAYNAHEHHGFKNVQRAEYCDAGIDFQPALCAN